MIPIVLACGTATDPVGEEPARPEIVALVLKERWQAPGIAGLRLAMPVEVTGIDEDGRVVAPGAVTLSLQGGPEGALLTGGSNGTPVGDAVVFDDLRIDRGGVAFSLVATDSRGLTARSYEFNVADEPRDPFVISGECGGICLGTSDGHWATVIRSSALGTTPDQPLLSPDGSLVAFHAGSWIMTARIDGTGLRTLTDGFGHGWSPDGTHLTLVRGSAAGDEVFTMRADGSDLTRLARGTSPVWSPDGERIAFHDGQEVYTIRPDGTEPILVTQGQYPAWSPDGSSLAAACETDTGVFAVCVVDLDGAASVALKETSVVDVCRVSDLQWASDASGITYLRTCFGEGGWGDPDYDPDDYLTGYLFFDFTDRSVKLAGMPTRHFP